MFLADNHVNSFWWTGATDLGREGHWYWAGSLANVGDFVWYKPANQPSVETGSNCMVLDEDWDFYGNDVPCKDYTQFFICQKK